MLGVEKKVDHSKYGILVNVCHDFSASRDD